MRIESVSRFADKTIRSGEGEWFGCARGLRITVPRRSGKNYARTNHSLARRACIPIASVLSRKSRRRLRRLRLRITNPRRSGRNNARTNHSRCASGLYCSELGNNLIQPAVLSAWRRLLELLFGNNANTGCEPKVVHPRCSQARGLCHLCHH